MKRLLQISPGTEAFVSWLVGDEGQKAVRQAGYVPLR